MHLADGTQRQLDGGKGTCAHRHGTKEGRSETLPEAPHALGPVRLGEAVAHALVLLGGAEAVGLHLALDDVEGVGAEPEGLTGQAAVEGDHVGGDVLALHAVAGSVRVHHVLKGHEPEAVGLGLADDGDGLAAVQAAQDALVGAQLAHAVEGPRVQRGGAVGLRLQPDAHVLDGARDDAVGDAGEGARVVVLGVAEVPALPVALLKVPLGEAEAAELHRHAGADAQERRQRALVEGEGALLLPDRRRGLERSAVLRAGLQAHLDNVKGLACRPRSVSLCFIPGLCQCLSTN